MTLYYIAFRSLRTVKRVTGHALYLLQARCGRCHSHAPAVVAHISHCSAAKASLGHALSHATDQRQCSKSSCTHVLFTVNFRMVAQMARGKWQWHDMEQVACTVLNSHLLLTEV